MIARRFIIAVVGWVSLAAPACAVITDTTGLVGYWACENTADSHGSNTLTNNGSATFASGKIGNGVSLSGGSSQHLSVTLGAISESKMTLAAWLNRSSTGNFVTCGFGSNNSKRFNFLWWTGGQVFYNIGVETPSVANSATGWHHFVMVFDGALGNPNTTLYYDGASAGTFFFNSSPYTDAAGVFSIGAELANSRYSTGMIDEVGLWQNRALSSTEVAALYNSGSGLAYPFTGGGGGGGGTPVRRQAIIVGSLDRKKWQPVDVRWQDSNLTVAMNP